MFRNGLKIRKSLQCCSLEPTLNIGIVLAVTCGFFITNNLILFKSSLEKHVDYTASILIQSLIPALTFHDSDAANEALQNLSIDKNFLIATVKTPDEKFLPPIAIVR